MIVMMVAVVVMIVVQWLYSLLIRQYVWEASSVSVVAFTQ